MSAVLTPAPTSASPTPSTAARDPRRRKRQRWTVSRVVRLVVLWAFAVYFGLPLVWLLLAPSKTDQELATLSPFSFGSFENYAIAWQNLLVFNDAVILAWIGNSLVYSVLAVGLALLVSIPAGYALAATRMPGRQLILTITLIAMVTPGAARVIPLFLELNAVGITNTMWSVILPQAFFPFGMYLAFIHYSSNLPRDLLDAARIDGASEAGIFARIALPLSKPVFGLVGFFAFLGSWNDYFLPFVMLGSTDKYTLPVGLGALIASAPGVNPSEATGASDLPIMRPEVALAGLLAILPVVLIFLVAQRSLISGALSGATKD